MADDTLHRSTRYPGNCSRCGSTIPIGSQAWWGNKKLTCTTCRPATDGPAHSSPAQPASGPSSAWSTYLRYLIACVEQESVINIDKLEAPNVWAQCDQTSERTLIDCHPIPATAIDSDRPTLLYGWPTVSIPTKRGRRVRFPLLVVTVRRSEEMFVVEDADIRINPALLGDLLEPEITEVIRQLPTTLEGQAWVASNLDESYVHTLGNKPQDWLRKISRPFWPSSGFLEEPPVR